MSEIVGTSEGKNGTTMLDYKQKKSSETFHSIYVERGFLKMQQQLSVGLVYPSRWINCPWSLLFLFLFAGTYFCGWLEKSQKFEPA